LKRRTRYVLAALLAGCAYSNEAILAELDARREPSPGLEAAIDRGGPASLLATAREAALPMLPGKVPAVLGRLNGVEMPLALDTGTSAVMVTAEAARDAGLYLSPRPAEPVIGAGHAAAHRVGAFSEIELGPNRFGPGVCTVAVNDRPGRWMELRTKRYAIVGCSVLSHFRVTFDFARREVRLAPAGRPAAGASLGARVEVNGRPCFLLVDSGATKLFLEPWAALEAGLLTPERAKRHEARAGRMDDALFTELTLESVRVAGRTFRDVDAAAVSTFGHERRGPAGLLGLAGFGRLVWTVDYGTRTLRLEP
jgi:predicted aspartyl protease